MRVFQSSRNGFKLSLVIFVVASAALAQEADDHKAHHPAQGDATEQGQPAAVTTAPGNPMAEMMGSMHTPPRKELYPSLLKFNDATEAERAQLHREAVKRAEQGAADMSSATAALTHALSRNNSDEIRQASRDIEAAIAQFRSGINTQMAISEPALAQTVALNWFQTEMNLPVQLQSQKTYFGLSGFHIAIMAMLAAFASLAGISYVGRMRRASELLVSLREPAANGAPDTFKGVLAHPRNAPEAQNPTTPISKREHWIGEVRIIGVFSETENVKTFRLALPDQSPIPFAYEPGQFCTVTVPAGPGGTDISRSYTIASSPTDRDAFELTIKRETKGAVSRHLHDEIDVGDNLRIKAPLGRFYFNGTQTDKIALVAGGVGVTPMMSALRYLAAHCWDGKIEFLYFAKTERDIIFRDELARLAAQLPNMRLHIWLSEPEDSSWTGRVGMINDDEVLDAVPEIASHHVHICGPELMMDAAKRTMLSLRVAPDAIKMESFGDAANAPPSARPKRKEGDQIFPIAFSRTDVSTEATSAETVLDAADEAGAPIERSCLAGTCGACIVRLLDGEVVMDVDDALEASEKAEGYILACQARPLTKLTVDA